MNPYANDAWKNDSWRYIREMGVFNSNTSMPPEPLSSSWVRELEILGELEEIGDGDGPLVENAVPYGCHHSTFPLPCADCARTAP